MEDDFRVPDDNHFNAENPSNSPATTLKFSCLPCRSRKLKCGRELPSCKRCARADVRCEYPASRKRHVVVATRPRVKELEARLNELEGRLKNEAASPDLPPTPYSSQGSGSDLVNTGLLEQLPPTDVMEELTNIYFERLYPDAPILHPARYRASLYLPTARKPPMCLQYAVLALGANLSQEHGHLGEAFYRRSRHYLEVDEMKNNGQDFVTLAHVQAWTLLGYYEVQALWFSRACMSDSRAVRLAQILGLDRLDGRGADKALMPPPRDWCELEERRRTFWATFQHDRACASTTGCPNLIDWTRITTHLPASEEAYQLGMPEPTVTLKKMLRHENIQVSAFARRVLSVHLFHECLDLNGYCGNFFNFSLEKDDTTSTASGIENDDDDDGDEDSEEIFWSRHRKLDAALATVLNNLPNDLRPVSNASSADAVNTSMMLHLASIILHRAGAAVLRNRSRTTDSQPREMDAFWRTQARLMPAAQDIFTAVAVTADIDARFRNPFVSFAAFMAASVFLEHFALVKDPRSEERLAALMALMVSIGQRNHVTASLAVQLAHQVKKTGIDPLALDKVKDLTKNMDPNVPLMAEQNDKTGSVLFCPFDHH